MDNVAAVLNRRNSSKEGPFCAVSQRVDCIELEALVFCRLGYGTLKNNIRYRFHICTLVWAFVFPSIVFEVFVFAACAPDPWTLPEHGEKPMLFVRKSAGKCLTLLELSTTAEPAASPAGPLLLPRRTSPPWIASAPRNQGPRSLLPRAVSLTARRQGRNVG